MPHCAAEPPQLTRATATFPGRSILLVAIFPLVLLQCCCTAEREAPAVVKISGEQPALGGHHGESGRRLTAFKKFHVPKQAEGKDFHIHYDVHREELPAASPTSAGAARGRPTNAAGDTTDQSVRDALARHHDLKDRVTVTLDRIHRANTGDGNARSKTSNAGTGGTDNAGGDGSKHTGGGGAHTDLYVFDFYKEKCDEPRDAFGFMCSECVRVCVHS